MNFMFIAIDIGGTNTRIGASRDGRRFFAIAKFKTPVRFEDGLQEIKRTVLRICAGQSLKRTIKIAIAVPGAINVTHKKLLRLPNLPGWRNAPIVHTLSRLLRTKSKIIMVNDADAAGLGEARRGAGSGYRRMAYFTISTGVGGALLINGKIDPKNSRFEPGHQLMIKGGRKCGCGRRGCFEVYGSGTGFYKTYGVRPKNCKNQRIWNKYARTLGQGIINAIMPWAPDVIVIGGGVSQVGTKLFTPLCAYIKQNLKTINPPPIKKAALGDLSGLYGCLELLK